MSYAPPPPLDPYQGPYEGSAYDHPAPRSVYVDTAAPYPAPMRPPPSGPVHRQSPNPPANYHPPAQQQQQPYYDGAYSGPPAAGYPAQYMAAAPHQQVPTPAVHYHVCNSTNSQHPGLHATQYSPQLAAAVPAAYAATPAQPPYSAAPPPAMGYVTSQPASPPPIMYSAATPVASHYGQPPQPPYQQPPQQPPQQQSYQQSYQQPPPQPPYQQPPQQQPYQQQQQPPQQPYQQQQYQQQQYQQYQPPAPMPAPAPYIRAQTDPSVARHGPLPLQQQSPQPQPQQAPYPASPAYDPRRASADMARAHEPYAYGGQAQPLGSAPIAGHPGARMSPVQQPQQHPPVRHSSLREQPVRHSPVAQVNQHQHQRHYSANPAPGHYEPARPQRLAPTQQLHPGDTTVCTGPAPAPVRGSYVRAGAPAGYCAPAQTHGRYDQQPQPQPQQRAAMASLASSMGALQLTQSQQQQQQRLALVASAVLSQPTLVGSSTMMPAPYRGMGPAAATNSSATLVRAHTAAPVASAPALPPTAEGGGVPMWGRINANSFNAYQHQIPVQKSSLSGTKHALVIGINYYEMEYSQTSNINSAHSMRDLLVVKYGYREKNVTLLSDGQDSERYHPTHQNITTAIRRMMREVRPNDSVFFYYCGFGRLPVQVHEKRTEVLGAIRRLRSDYILPSDFETTGAIDAAYLHKTLVHQLPPSARLTALFNCIVSETGLGVPYKYSSASGTPVLTNAIAGSNLFEAGIKAGHACTASFGDLSQRLEASLMQQQHQGAGAEALDRIRQSSGDIVVFGWDRDYGNPKHKQYLSHTPSTQLGTYWAAAMENVVAARGIPTFGTVLGYLRASTDELAMLPFVACGRKITMDDEFVI